MWRTYSKEVFRVLILFLSTVSCQPPYYDWSTTPSYNYYNPYTNSYTVNTYTDRNNRPEFTEHPGGTFTNDRVAFTRYRSPYLIRNDIIVEENAEMVIEPGVEMRFQPQTGITVRGVLTAVGTAEETITLTTAEEASARNILLPDIRLVDGPSILAGRVQLKHNGIWRSVCTNSKNWTLADMETACRQLGFQGGTFFNWFNRQMPLKPRLLYEEPNCIGTESTIFECQWNSRQMGAGVCDYHPDLAIECLPRHDHNLPFWRGIRFENAKYSKVLTLQNTLYVPRSNSRLEHVVVKYAGTGRYQNASDAVHVHGIPPIMDHIDVLYSAYNGINITLPDGGFEISNCKVTGNRGYGIFINSTFGLARIDKCTVTENGGDGIRYVHTEERPDEKYDKSNVYDFCTLATTAGQTYPLQVFAEQELFSNRDTRCTKTFKTRFDHVITLYFLRAETHRNASASIEVYDGSGTNNRHIISFQIYNNTRPQSVTTISNQIHIVFNAEPRTRTFMYMRLLSGLSKTYDLNVSRSDISENNGRGIAIDNLKSHVHIHDSSISKNNHVAGLHVTSGVGNVNVTQSRISFNEGDGINITYTGGCRNISRSWVTSNQGYGVAVWLNDTKETEYIYVNQSSVVQYSNIVKNLDIGVLHGNFCGDANVNITGNTFENSLHDALEILSCWRISNHSLKLQIGHNNFISNHRIGVKIKPALNIDGRIEFNSFKKGLHGALLIKNKPLEEFNVLPLKIIVQQNYFLQNMGIFVVNMGLSPYSESQYLLFTRNFVRDNVITEPFLPEDGSADGSAGSLIPRSRVAAPVCVGSNNIEIFRNIIDNPASKYEIGSQLEDQSKVINCTFNWIGSSNEEAIFNRIFHRYNRYNLARISYVPFLLHNSNPLTTRTNTIQLYVPLFNTKDTSNVGGEIEGEETLTRGEYVVEKDINIRPGGKLTLEPGVTLRFPPSIGIMVGGKLEARGDEPDSIKFTLKEEISFVNTSFDEENPVESDTEIVEVESKVPVRLLGGKVDTEGRLQVKIDGEWGTVCNYNWNIKDAALVCHQLGLALNPYDWYLERNEIPDAGTSEGIILSNVQCEDHDIDITKCRSEKKNDFEKSCTHENDVGVRCYKTSWAGVRFGVLAERSNLQFITIEKSGLLDYSANAFKPALQMDFARHNFEDIRISDNFHDGLSIMYSDIYTEDTVNVVKNSEFVNNKGAGISFKQLGLKVIGGVIENNYIGIEHNPALTGLQQRELAGWFTNQEPEISYRPFWIPHENDVNEFYISQGETKYLVTSQVTVDSISRSYRIRCIPGYVIGIQLLNPIENRSSEIIKIHDSQSYNNRSDVWDLRRDLTVFPTTASSHGIIIDYVSGTYSLGGTVLVLSAIRAPVQDVYNRIVKGPVPTTTINGAKIRNNVYGVHVSYYNRYLNELGDHFLRKANETLKIISSEISHNHREAMFVHSPHWDLHKSNISETVFMINKTLITDNGGGIFHFSRDMRASNNLFHYILEDDTIERNGADGFHINLPYVWQYNENFTHSVYMSNNTWRNNRNFKIIIDGHFAIVNITRSLFSNNQCNQGLLSMRGMEKKMLINFNKFENNNGKYIVDFSSDSQSEIVGEVPARFVFNEFYRNRYMSSVRGFGVFQVQHYPTSVVNFRGIQKVNINRNLFSENNLEYQLVAGIRTAKINNFVDVTENWWGTNIEEEIRRVIFDFDDWNNHAIARFMPFLVENNFEGSHSMSTESNRPINLDNLGGRINEDLVIPQRSDPYIINQDITVMPHTTLTISPGVVMEFAPNVGILVLGSLKAQGLKGAEIIMRPLQQTTNLETKYIEKRDVREKRELENFAMQDSIRLCKGRNCEDKELNNEGFLEYFNKTTLQWIPMCDPRFTERNAQVVCRELGFDYLSAFFEYDIRIEYHSNSLSRIWSWPEPLQCKGTENRYEDCPIRLNGQQFGHRHECKWNSRFVFIHCEEPHLKSGLQYWGGVRFTDSEFEQRLYEHRIHDVNTHDTIKREESIIELVNIIGAGILHNEKSPAVQSVVKSPKINFISVTQSASHGINLISPADTMNLISNTVTDSLGVGINILSIPGEGRESDESSFTPVTDLNIPYNIFSLLDICDTVKEVKIEERIIIYYKYDNHPVNCVKIIKSAYNIKPLGFRLMQFNLFNSTNNKYGIPDLIQLYDGDPRSYSIIRWRHL
ncbi:Scavenger receptor cysteine-rich domain [Popillia japonica]|uniref:Scavenger receptor cysteine-rich domain n=1 Tax=Popillia japonica TaxID=7064 RepID=A0AAW1LZN6_POPJA